MQELQRQQYVLLVLPVLQVLLAQQRVPLMLVNIIKMVPLLYAQQVLIALPVQQPQLHVPLVLIQPLEQQYVLFVLPALHVRLQV